jgi:hypothetical protein
MEDGSGNPIHFPKVWTQNCVNRAGLQNVHRHVTSSLSTELCTVLRVLNPGRARITHVFHSRWNQIPVLLPDARLPIIRNSNFLLAMVNIFHGNHVPLCPSNCGPRTTGTPQDGLWCYIVCIVLYDTLKIKK